MGLTALFYRQTEGVSRNDTPGMLYYQQYGPKEQCYGRFITISHRLWDEWGR